MDLTFDHFKDRIGEEFAAAVQDGTTLGLVLTEAEERPANPAASQGFSLMFRAAGERVFEQQTFEVSHPDLGTHPIFLVPVAASSDGALYEAVFTR